MPVRFSYIFSRIELRSSQQGCFFKSARSTENIFSRLAYIICSARYQSIDVCRAPAMKLLPNVVCCPKTFEWKIRLCVVPRLTTSCAPVEKLLESVLWPSFRNGCRAQYRVVSKECLQFHVFSNRAKGANGSNLTFGTTHLSPSTLIAR